MDIESKEVEFTEKSGQSAQDEKPKAVPRSDPIKRNTAIKLRLGQIANAKQIMDGERFKYLDFGDKKVIRVNVVANVIDKYLSEGESKFGSLTLDDASGQIRVRAFGDDTDKFFSNVTQGDAVIIIGMLRVFNNEIYIIPDLVKLVDSMYLLVRKLEVEEKVMGKKELMNLKDRILGSIKERDVGFGVSIEDLQKEIGGPETMQQEIKKLLEEGVVYESRPGVMRYLG